MASGVTSPLGIFAIVLLIIGIIMAIIGIIFVISQQNQTKAWWVWAMLIGGLVLAVFGGILLAVALASYEKPEPVPEPHHHHHHAPEPVMCPPPQPVYRPPVNDYHHHNHHAHNGYYYAAHPPAPAYVPPTPAYAPPPPVYPSTVAPPSANYTNVHTVGDASFDPDPQMISRRVQPSAQRVTATGPYGPNGETVTVNGTFTPAPLEIDHTYDIPNHKVAVTGAYPRMGYPAV